MSACLIHTAARSHDTAPPPTTSSTTPSLLHLCYHHLYYSVLWVPACMQPVLDYHDVLLRQQDVQLLEGPHWLNDQVGVGPPTTATPAEVCADLPACLLPGLPIADRLLLRVAGPRKACSTGRSDTACPGLHDLPPVTLGYVLAVSWSSSISAAHSG